MATTTHPAWLSRQALLTQSAATLPLGRAGDGLRTRLREASDDVGPAVVRAWREALDALHQAGWGTEDAVRSALVTDGGRVRFLPDLVWPIGALHAGRPIAPWLDLDQAHAWLIRAGASDAERAPFASAAPPWPAWPAPPAAGPFALVGPVRETAALAEAAGIPWLPAGQLHTDVARRWVLDALMRDRPWCVSLAHADQRSDLPLIPLETLTISGGGVIPLSPAERASFDMHPDGETPPSHRIAQTPTRETLQRGIEAAALSADPRDRADTEAKALLDGLATAQFEQPLDQLAARLERIVALARTAGNRRLAAKATFRRGLVRCLSPDPDVYDAGLGDLTDARRLVAAQGMRDEAATYSAARRIAETLQRQGRSGDLEQDAPSAESSATAAALISGEVAAWQRVAAGLETLSAVGTQLDEPALKTLVNAALLLDEPFVLAAVCEGIGGAAILTGHEAAGERLIMALAGAGLGPEASAVVTGWRALLAARRGATLSARESILTVASQLDAARITPKRPGSLWWTRAALSCALAARTQGNPGLAEHFVQLVGGHHTPLARLATAPPPLENVAYGARWWRLLAAEAAVERRESDARQTRAQLMRDYDAVEPASWPSGVALVLGRLALKCHEPAAAREALKIAATGERHLEQRALSLLVTLDDPDEAVVRRLAQLEAQTLPSPALDLPPPLTVDQAIATELAAVHRAALGAGTRPDDRWRGAVEALTGSTLEPPPPASAIARAVLIDRDTDGNWQIESGRDHHARLAGPPEVAPRTAARALQALAPLFSAFARDHAAQPEAAPDASPRAWAEATDIALVSADLRFDDVVVAPFKRHDLTRAQVRWLLHLGLTATTGSYRALAARWRVADAEYQRFMDFLRRANAALDFRPYRQPASMPSAPVEPAD